MWNWLFICLVRGATIVLFDGSPVYPETGRLFDIAEKEGVNFFGVSAKYIDGIKKAGLEPKKTHDLSNLRMIGSTGSVLVPESFDYIYEHVKADVHLASLSGGTDICGCFVASIPTLPVYRGEIQGPCLGMATKVFDAIGVETKDSEKGELVCTVPFPSKPIGFWGDTANEKYISAYFSGFPKVWTHGDFAARSETGGFTLYGRSDATLNSRGVRIGTAEIYRVVETFSEIQESMAVSQDWDDDTRVILFVTLKEGATFTNEFADRIKKTLREKASPRHVPDKILVTPELPRTKSNKLVELAVTDVINGREVRNRDALANPNALDWFKNLPELSE
jgi:acetoacetyl-CoA synthetase